MSDFTSLPDELLDRWLADQHHFLVDDLAAALDLEAGLREAMIPAWHAGLVADLRDVLDVEAGLSAIVSANRDTQFQADVEPSRPAQPRIVERDHGDPAVLDAPARVLRRRYRYAFTVLAALLILVLSATSIAVWQRQSAAQRIAITDQLVARQLVAQAKVARDTDPRTALQLALAAWRINSDQETQSNLITLVSTTRYFGTLTGHTGPVLGEAFSPDGRTLATASADRSVRLWDLTDPRHPSTEATLAGHTGPVTALAFSPDGHTLATSSLDRTVRLWNLTDRAHPNALGSPLTGQAGTVDAVAFSPDGHTLASASAEKTIWLWDVIDRAHATPLSVLTDQTDTVTAVAFSPDARTLATGNFDRTVRLWDLTDPHRPRTLTTLTGHTDAVTAVVFSPDGHTLATASGDRTVILWDVRDRAEPRRLGQPLTGHGSTVNSVAFNPDGSILATASADQIVRLWDVATHQLLDALAGHSGVVRSVGFAPNGQTLASASDNGTTVLWDLRGLSINNAEAQMIQAEAAKKQAEDDLKKRIEEVWVEQAIARACSVTGGGLNRAQWASYISGPQYEQTCR